MSELRLETYTMPAALLGPENPLPPLFSQRTAGAAAGGTQEPAAPDYPDRGRENIILPYRLQDRYDRRRAAHPFKAAVLENDILRATFLLEVGGRLWSLLHKPTGRELLHVNPVFQPANLAIRDAWFSGGVEWNIGIIGHCVFTCSPLFAARVLADDGAPVLRLYEWERTRGVIFQIDCRLPDGWPFLLVRVRIVNPNAHAVPMYWWSNIAVEETADTRVLAPATEAYCHDHKGALLRRSVPVHDGVDASYPVNRRSSGDLYFNIPDGQRPWIAALDGRGAGLVHTSTKRLFGRKLWAWGMGPGGRRWQEFLSEPGRAYIELQGGLARTQAEYVPMPAATGWSWLEAYGLLECDPKQIHGRDWGAACRQVEGQLSRLLPAEKMASELERTGALADRAPVEILQHGSGWGALEQRRRQRCGEALLPTTPTPFPDRTLGPDQQPWLRLLEEGTLPASSPLEEPGQLMVQPQWQALLEDAVRSGRCDHWLAWWHLGVMRWRVGDRAAAGEAWGRSHQLAPSPWALRNLAVLKREDGDAAAAAELWLAAARMAPTVIPLAVECCQALLRANRPAEVLELHNLLPPDVRSASRIQMLHAMAALEVGDLETVGRFFASDFEATNLRESEVSLSDLWFAYHEKRLAAKRGIAVDDALRQEVRRDLPPPRRFDFRMTGG